MPRYEVTYKVFTNNIHESGTWESQGPSHYTTVVEAINQPAAQQMVQNMNGGSAHCYITRCMYLGG